MLRQHDETFFVIALFSFEYLYTSFLSIVNLHLVILNFLDYCVTGAEKAG
jgi:hypothetical protein